MSKNKIIPIVIVVMLVVGGGTFYGGMKYAQSNPPAGGPQGLKGDFQNLQNLSPEERQQRLQELGTRTNVFRNRPGGQQGGSSVSGEIIAKDDSSITVKLRDGGSRIIFFSDSTEITKSVGGAASDFEIGKTAVIEGKQNSDGSLTAETIQLRSSF